MPALVFLEHHNGKVKSSSLQAAGACCTKLAGKMSLPTLGLLIGEGALTAAESAKNCGLEKIFVMDGVGYTPSTHAACLADFAAKRKPEIILASATAMAREFIPMAAATLGVGVLADCIDADVGDDGTPSFLRPIYAGKVREKVSSRFNPVVATLRPNAFPMPGAGGEASIEEVEPPSIDAKTKRVEFTPAAGGRPELTEARVIVSGGRGIADPKNYSYIEELADALGNAATGASRAVVDAGWKDHSFQVGQTGKTVSPELYVAVGISGAVQHLAGMSSSKNILAVNKDPDANIFKKADYGIVGDLFEIVPKLIDAIKKAKS
ncbi:MAG: electron transfer flavoprotein subunit alpha [bacterium]|nr:MAG: electron transfer flavoprotein subunit alpha [bacterium]